MDNDAGMRKLVELICGKKVTTLGEMEAQNSSFTTCFLTGDFPKKMEDVLFLRKLVVLERWGAFFDTYYRNMLSSHAMYLSCVMNACIYEQECILNIFDSFISVCGLVIYFSDEILEKTNINFSDLNVDIIMELYRNVLKKKFHKRGGFRAFAKYIHRHKYLSWNWNRNDFVSSDNPTVPFLLIDKELFDSLQKELRSYREVCTSSWLSKSEVTGLPLAMEVLSTTSVELPTLPSEPELIRRLVAYRKKKMAAESKKQRRIEETVKLRTLNVDSQTCFGSNSDTKSNYAAKHQENAAHYNDIIQAVIKHNHSKNLGHENASDQAQKVDEILEHLKSTIKSLIKLIDE